MNYDLKISENSELDNLYFESHLEMTELDLYVAMGVYVTTDIVKEYEKTCQLCCAINREMIGASRHVYLCLDFLVSRTGAGSGG